MGLIEDMQMSGRMGEDRSGRCVMPVEADPGAIYIEEQLWDNMSGKCLDPDGEASQEGRDGRVQEAWRVQQCTKTGAL